jgi:hypothetical protein
VFQEGDSPDFTGLSGAGLTGSDGFAKGLQMPSTAEELAAERHSAAVRFFLSLSQGFCFNRESAMLEF